MESQGQSEEPYWATKPSIAPIKAEYVLWDRVRGHGTAGESSSSANVKKSELPPPADLDDDDAAEGRPSTGAGARNTKPFSDLSRSNEEPPRKKQKGGMNKGRVFAKVSDEGAKLCLYTARGQTCGREQSGLTCSHLHDIKSYIRDQKHDDIRTERIDADGPQEQVCPSFENLGICPFGFKCRFSGSHTQIVPEGEGFLGSDRILVHHFEKLRIRAPDHLSTDEQRYQWACETRGELNVVVPDIVHQVRKTKSDELPITKAYLESIGQPLDTRSHVQGRGGKQAGKGGARNAERSTNGGSAVSTADPSPQESTSQGTEETELTGAKEASMAVDNSKDSPDVPLRGVEKRRLRFEGQTYLAPLTTVGNLPFRQLCVKYGCEITCGEMGLAQEYIAGNKGEWSLTRRHPSERTFGVQLCGNRPQTLVAATEMVVKQCPDLDFIDLNLGCPIDLVTKKGAGSALLDHASKLTKILKGMNYAAGDVPITIKMRTGIKTGINTTHKLMPRAVQEWGVGAVAVHGRTQQQRYSKTADYDYIKTCVTALRNAADELDVPPIPIFGNGDAYDYRSYHQNVEETGVDGIMVARGALLKPWIFTELKERRDWDISSRERLDMIGDLTKFGLAHWGSDTLGVNQVRRFVCEALSFTYRYVPVGLLERFPAKMNDRPYPFKGRDELETLLASDNSEDWVKISNMFLGPPPPEFNFIPKHKSNAYGSTEESNG